MLTSIPAVVRLTALVFLAVNNITATTGVLETVNLMETATVSAIERWRKFLKSDTMGCSAGVADPYYWRTAGYGSNTNFLLLAWANAILEGRDDVGVVLDTDLLFPRTTCLLPSNGEETRRGWHCFFASMPHLCSFDNRKELNEFNKLRGLPANATETSDPERGSVDFLSDRIEFINHSAEQAGTGTFQLLAMLYEHLTSHFQPWFKADVEALLAEPDIAAVQARKYVGLHIRRTDKQIYDHGPFTPTEEYLKRAYEYLRTSPDGCNSSDITGIWLSTDDDVVLDEVKSLTPKYFPGVEPEAVVFITSRVPVALLNPATFVSGTADRNTYEAVVLLMTELTMLARAEVFSGTFTSNLGRIVALMRETLKKPRASALSSDNPTWFPGRS